MKALASSVIRIVESASGAERIEAARAFLSALPRAAEALVVGASREAADDLARRVTAAAAATCGLHRASLTQLAVPTAPAWLQRAGLGADVIGTGAKQRGSGGGGRPHPSNPLMRRKAVDRRLREELAKLDLRLNEAKSRIVDLGRGEAFGLRPDPAAVLAGLAEIDGPDAEYRVGIVPASWLETRAVGEATIRGDYADIGHAASLTSLRGHGWPPHSLRYRRSR